MDRLVQEMEQMAVKVTLWAERAEGTESNRERAITGSLRGQEASSGTGRTCPGRWRQVGTSSSSQGVEG